MFSREKEEEYWDDQCNLEIWSFVSEEPVTLTELISYGMTFTLPLSITLFSLITYAIYDDGSFSDFQNLEIEKFLEYANNYSFSMFFCW